MAHILVVDDEINIRKVVREYAEFEGYEVTEAENGMEAVNFCHDNDYDDERDQKADRVFLCGFFNLAFCLSFDFLLNFLFGISCHKTTFI